LVHQLVAPQLHNRVVTPTEQPAAHPFPSLPQSLLFHVGALHNNKERKLIYISYGESKKF